MNQNELISRRKFLAITGTAAAALVCAACVKIDPSNSANQAEAVSSAAEAVSATASTPTAQVSSNQAVPQVPQATATQLPLPTTTQSAQISQVQTNGFRCPKNLVNDPYPGRCRHYHDSNGNGFCDYSQV